MFCLPKNLVDDFLRKLKSGEITPEKLLAMSSKQRRVYFAEFLGENNAQEVNYLLESKLILKDQIRGIINWAKQVSGMKPEAMRNMLSRVDKMTDILTPENEDVFLEDLAAHKLGVAVTMNEAADITELARTAMEKKEAMDAGARRPLGSVKATPAEHEYGLALAAFDNYINGLKVEAKTETVPQMLSDFIKNPVQGSMDVLSDVAGTSKAMVASLDNSFIGRQGIQVFYKGVTGDVESAKTWSSTFFKSFKIIWDTFGGKPVMDEIKAIIVSDPEYQMLRRAGVAVGTVEEMFPQTLLFRMLEKIPLAGKAFEASENAYTGSAYWMRYRVAKEYFGIAQKTGVDLTDNFELKSIGKLTNSLTARGETGLKRQTPGVINNVFWSPKMMKAAIDVLTAHQFDRSMSPFARRQAALNLLHIVAGTAMVLGIASLIDPDSVEWEPRSSNFGKIKWGNTRFIVNPFAPFIVLAARLIPTRHDGVWGMWSKSSTTGKWSNLREKGYGKKTGFDVAIDFLTNKTAPLASGVIDWLKNRNREDFTKPFDVKQEATKLVAPLIIQNYSELADDPEAANIFLAMMAEAIGVGTQTYSQFGNLTDEQLRDKITKVTKKDGSPRKGREEDVKVMKEELLRRKLKD